MRARYLGLHDLAFLERGINPLSIGIPGTGKTFLARSLGFKACHTAKRVVLVAAPKMLNELHAAEMHGSLEKALNRYVRADLLAIEDFAVLAMDPAQAKLAFQVISERYESKQQQNNASADVTQDNILTPEVIAASEKIWEAKRQSGALERGPGYPAVQWSLTTTEHASAAPTLASAPPSQNRLTVELTRFGGQTKPGVISQEVHRHGNPKTIPRRVQA